MTAVAATPVVREGPILFSGPMVRAIRDGRKSQTRRVVKVPRYATLKGARVETDLLDPDRAMYLMCDRADGDGLYLASCPYGAVGDRLWVRESHVFVADEFQLRPGIVYRADDTLVWRDSLPDGTLVWNESKRADWKWRPSIHMPRWASRITLEITGVRVERLQAMPWQDAIEEGIEPVACKHFNEIPGYGCTDCMNTGVLENPLPEYETLWDSINGKRGFGWDVNPWVWVVEFRRIDA